MNSTIANPLLLTPEQPYAAWDMAALTPCQFREALDEGMRLQRLEIERIAENTETPTFANTVAALDRAGKVLNRASLTLGNLEAALGTPELQDLMAEYAPKLSQLATETILNEKLWLRIKTVFDNKEALGALTPEQRRLVEETHREFAENGAQLSGEGRKEYQRINNELSALSVKFSQNVTEEMRSEGKRLWISGEEADGLPANIVEAARAAASEALAAQGKDDDPDLLLFTMFAPSYVPFMKYARRRDLREKLYRMYASRNMQGQFDNRPVLTRIAAARLELARIMGLSDYAQYKLQGTMAATPEAVTAFLDELRRAYSQPMHRELDELQEFARAAEGPDFRLMPWDYSYWLNRFRTERHDFNEEELKPYFELDNTIAGVFGLATKLYGYTFTPADVTGTYHPDVKTFEVKDRDGKLLGLLYADFFYREGKSPGAWMTEFRSSVKDDEGNRELPLISIVMNFSKPVAGKPVLLTPSEVETFLHEFGHALHGLSTQAVYSSFSGTNVYHDFVELFSQFNENYLTQKEFLDSFARHAETGEKIPDSLLDAFITSHRTGAAYACMRQLEFGVLDMAWHTLPDNVPSDSEVWEFEKKAKESVKCFEAIEGCAVSPSFGHIFSGGYAAGYYGYKWSEVLDADAFGKFRENGIFDPATAESFLRMLEAGGTEDPMTLYIRFRGRKPTVDALLERDGIERN